MNQSELGEKASNWRQASENACDQVMVGFRFPSSCIAWETGASFANATNTTKRNATRITFDTKLKSALVMWQVSKFRLRTWQQMMQFKRG